ncbi:ATP-binding protein [Kosakonia sp. BK9b]|uniref:sensor histidine kinase n=1 Tax=Kosakonia sp. TaxID=1916651 RepID=UPI00289CABCD|nr:ATP-binding protein [Kosakonia sp.]
MKPFQSQPQKEPRTLWAWICRRLVSLAVGSIFIIAFLMWLRFYVQNKWHEYRMPEAVRAELAVLLQNPMQDINRYHQIIDTWYGLHYSDPTIGVMDWLILVALVLVFIPVIVLVTLKAARPISHHIGRLDRAARSVATGGFGYKIPVPETLPLELRSLTENFNGMSLQLERYEKDLKKAHVMLAHELRSPLTAAIGRLQGMIDGIFEPTPDQLNMVMRQMKALNRLVEDLHLLKLADAGELNLNIMPVNINDIVREKIAWITPTAEKAGVAITQQKLPALTAMADPYRIGQVFLILMDNALRYAADGKIIAISYRTDGETVSVIFRDQGPAVADNFLENIFAPFVREDTSRSRHAGGSGLGLSIAHAICAAHGGKLSVEKCSEGGLAFNVQLRVR